MDSDKNPISFWTKLAYITAFLTAVGGLGGLVKKCTITTSRNDRTHIANPRPVIPPPVKTFGQDLACG